MILDSSAVIAVLFQEPEGPEFSRAIASAEDVRISAATLVEITAVLASRSPALEEVAEDLLAGIAPVVEPLTEAQSELARQAYRTYGRGSGHPAKLTLGDCFSYALATDLDLPLLYAGDDFAHTDVTSRSERPGRTPA